MLSAGWRTLIAMACATSVQVMPGYASELSVDRLPPWQNGANNPAQDKGLEFTVKEADNLADFHGDVTNARLVLYVGGNYFFPWHRWWRPSRRNTPISRAASITRPSRLGSSRGR